MQDIDLTKGRFLSSFPFQVFRELSLFMSLILINVLKYNLADKITISQLVA